MANQPLTTDSGVAPPTAPTPPTPPTLPAAPTPPTAPTLTATGATRTAPRPAMRRTAPLPPSAPVTPPAPRNPVPESFTNNDRLWLTYETIYNQNKFRKSNQPHNLGLFRIPLPHVCIILRQDLHDDRGDELFKKLRACFLPELDFLDAAKDRRKDYAPTPWNPAHPADPIRTPSTPSTASATRSVSTVYSGPWVVMPFNQRDHDGSELTVGLDSPTPQGHTIWPLNKSLDMYSTASRSSVVKPVAITVTAGNWAPHTPMDSTSQPLPPAAYWQLGSGGDTSDLGGGREFKLGSDQADFVSLKCGITYVGTDYQGGKKAKLEDDSIIAAMRSDYIVEVDKQLGKDTFSDPDLLILSEVLTIVEPGTSPTAFKNGGDGFQVRDLRGLKADMIYFPPLSVPFVDTELKRLRKRYEVLCGSDDTAAREWVAFWATRLAEPVGRAKALLMMRYGLQSMTPNAQNFLLELRSDLRPTGRVVLRDVGDFLMHREAVWALWGPGTGTPPVGDKNTIQKAMVDGLSLDVLKYEWRKYDRTATDRGLFGLKLGENVYPVETGSFEDDALSEDKPYPRDTQFHWHFYTSLGRGKSLVAVGAGTMDPDARNPGWQKVLWANALWGIEHNNAYRKCVEDCLGIDSGINYQADPAPRADRYLALSNPTGPTDTQPYQQAERYWKEDNLWERRAANRLHQKLCTEEGQKALRAYKDRGWTPASTT